MKVVAEGNANRISIDGTEYIRTIILTTAHGITIRYAQADDSSKTVTFRKDNLMRNHPEAAKVIFDPRNW